MFIRILVLYWYLYFRKQVRKLTLTFKEHYHLNVVWK